MSTKRDRSILILSLVLSTLLTLFTRSNAQCVASGFTPACNTALSGICFNSQTYDTCVNHAHAPCYTDFDDPCNHLCNNYYNDIKTCLAENGTGQSQETVVLQAWLATCNTFLPTGSYNFSYDCWLYGGSYCYGAATPASIRIYTALNCKGAYGLCSHVSADMCCHFNNGTTFKSAEFVKVPANALGGTFKKSGTATCSTVTADREGPGCVNGASGGQNGAGYECCGSKAKLATRGTALEDFNCTGSVVADVAVIDGHYFRMGNTIPARDSAKFRALIQEDASFANVPEHLKEYEIDEP